ncbi:MAG: methyltransferase family protein, partial [Beijerinckiaceae bacterium]
AWLELKIPPPLVVAAAAGLLWLADLGWPGFGRPAAAWRWAGIGILASAGLALDATAAWRFIRARTTILPMNPARTQALVTGGLYRFSRNPMYLGQTLLLAAFALWLGHAVGLIAVPAFMAYLTRFQIVPEERILAARFPADYAAYRARVRRWL